MKLLSRKDSTANYSIHTVKDEGIAGFSSGENRFYQIDKLSNTGFNVVNEASHSRYYDWMSIHDLNTVSNTFSLSKPTGLYHIRNAEKKIIGTLFSK